MLLNQDEELLIQAEPYKIDGAVNNGAEEVISLEMEKASGSNLVDSFSYDMGIEEYDEVVIELIIELFYARNKAGHLDYANAHEMAVNDIVPVVQKLFKAIGDEIPEEYIMQVVSEKRGIQLEEEEEDEETEEEKTDDGNSELGFL